MLKHDHYDSCTVGVLTTRKKSNTHPQGRKARILRDLIDCGQRKGIFIYFFYPSGVDQKKKLIKGYTVSNKGKWLAGVFPWPNIIYNRIVNRNIESQQAVKNLLNSFEKDGDTYLFNTRFLDKWEVYQAIMRSPSGQKIVPETAEYKQENLKNALEKYPEVFLKPKNSCKGQGIIKIKSGSGKGFQYAKAGRSTIKWNSAASFTALSHQLIHENVTNMHYLIQRGLNLARYQGNIFDLRTQAQKDGAGKWVMTGTAVRVAGRNKFVTHIPNGGRAASYKRVIDTAFGENTSLRARIDSQIKNLCLLVPGILEKELGLNLAVLSMDIGVDAGGRVWLIEVNSKPASFDEPHIQEKHLQYLTDYFLFIYAEKQKMNKRKDI